MTAGILTYIRTLDQPLPVNMNKFWALTENKVSLQQIFIDWITQTKFDTTIFLGGSHKSNEEMCISIVDGLTTTERLLKCSHEEADDRI